MNNVTTLYFFLRAEKRPSWTRWGRRWSSMKKEWKVGRWAAEHKEGRKKKKKSENSLVSKCFSPLGGDWTWTVLEAETAEASRREHAGLCITSVVRNYSVFRLCVNVFLLFVYTCFPSCDDLRDRQPVGPGSWHVASDPSDHKIRRGHTRTHTRGDLRLKIRQSMRQGISWPFLFLTCYHLSGF